MFDHNLLNDFDTCTVNKPNSERESSSLRKLPDPDTLNFRINENKEDLSSHNLDATKLLSEQDTRLNQFDLHSEDKLFQQNHLNETNSQLISALKNIEIAINELKIEVKTIGQIISKTFSQTSAPTYNLSVFSDSQQQQQHPQHQQQFHNLKNNNIHQLENSTNPVFARISALPNTINESPQIKKEFCEYKITSKNGSINTPSMVTNEQILNEKKTQPVYNQIPKSKQFNAAPFTSAMIKEPVTINVEKDTLDIEAEKSRMMEQQQRRAKLHQEAQALMHSIFTDAGQAKKTNLFDEDQDIDVTAKGNPLFD